jgi:VWFA-related protein
MVISNLALRLLSKSLGNQTFIFKWRESAMFIDRMKWNPFLRMCFAIMSLVMLPLIGCGGGGGGGSSSSTPAPQPTADISVSRTQIAFGDTVVNRSSSDETVSVQNTGPAILNIDKIAGTSSSPAAFSILNDNCSLKSFSQGESCTFQVRFSPSAEGAVTGAFNIPSNDPDENPVVVNVSGYGRSLYVSINERTCLSPSGVRLLANVTDKDAYPLTGLLATHVSLTENGSPRSIGNFYLLAEPISVAVALDYSGSMRTNNNVVPMEAAAKIFIDRLNPAIGDEASIIKFSTIYETMQDFTTDKSLLLAAVDKTFTDPRDETAMFHTLLYAIDETAKRTNRRAVVVITDARDNFSQETITDVIASAKAKSVRLFTIGLGLDADAGVLQQLANETGGTFFYSPTADDLSLFYRQIADTLVGQYALEFASQVTGSGSMALDLQVNYNGMTGRATKSLTGCP